MKTAEEFFIEVMDFRPKKQYMISTNRCTELMQQYAEQYYEERIKSILLEFLEYVEERESNDPEIIDEFLDQTNKQ